MLKKKLRWLIVPVIVAAAFVGASSFTDASESHLHASCKAGSDGNCVHRRCTVQGCEYLVNICEATEGFANCKVSEF